MFVKNNKKIKLDYIFLIIIFGILHFFMKFISWDDPSFINALQSYQLNLGELLIDRYSKWSSRVIIEAVFFTLGYLPKFIWKIADVLFVLFFYTNIRVLVNNLYQIKKVNFAEEKIDASVLFFLCWPFSTMGTTGWLTSTICTLWVIVGVLYFINFLIEICFLEKNIIINKHVISFLCLLYASNHESASPVLFCVILITFCILKIKKYRIPRVLYIGWGIVIGGILGTVLCPGNSIRLNGTENKVGYLQITMIDKIRMGINTLFYHIMSVPNALVFLLCLLLVFSVIYKSKSIFCRVCGCIPLVMDLLWTGYFFVKYTILGRRLTYIYPDEKFIEGGFLEQSLAFGSAILILISVIASLYMLYEDKEFFLIVSFIAVIGLLPIVVLGFTPAISASILRVAIYPYTSIMLLLYLLFMRFKEAMSKRQIVLIYIVAIVGSICNLLQVIRHISLYG